ncbi:PREDICTED: zinc finger MYM-type [Prunus dulcis]|uniref:PREDICTED: zinc finger MYM-type n=1 Tax=Prunus dulcis TaxID=3755 RepID=A0A5E4FS89_PRUDU|nr:PREDICTED: zinc finger MYM-type [Prunus dulcis]
MADKLRNKGAIKSILTRAWREYGEAKICWVQDNIFSIIVKDELMADKLVNNGPWQVMKKCFSMRRWPSTLAIKEIQGSDEGRRWLEQSYKGDERRRVREKVRPRIEQIKSVKMAVESLENNIWCGVFNIL